MKLNKIFIKPLLLLLLTLSPYGFSSEISAPSEMEWGKSKAEVKRTGLTISDCKSLLNGDVEYCDAKGYAKPISFAEDYTLYFLKGYGLHKVYITGKNITNDAYGTSGKSTFNKVFNSLSKKYPEDDGYKYSEFQWVGQKLYDESDEFYECLGYDGCGSWINFISTSDDLDRGTFSVELQGISRGKGYLTLTYESSNWSEYLDVVKNRESARDDDAF